MYNIVVELLKKRYFKAFLQFIEVLLTAFHVFGWSIVWQPNWLSHKISFCFYIILKKVSIEIRGLFRIHIRNQNLY